MISNNFQKLPNFLGIGTQRAATTWLYNCLLEHPDIYLPEKKELLFFSKYFDRGVDYYKSFFTTARNGQMKGEISPEYLSYEICPQRIKELLPNVKMIVILRDPIERAYSAYKIFHKNNGISFESAINDYPALLNTGLYASHLKRYFNLFKRDQFLILLYDDIQKDNTSSLRLIYRFLGLDEDFLPTWIDKSANTQILPGLQKVLIAYNLNFIIELVKKTPFDNFIRARHRKKGIKTTSKIFDEVEKNVMDKLKEFYYQPNLELFKLLDFNLDGWHK